MSCVRKRWPDLNTVTAASIPRTWGTPLRKAEGPNPGDYEWLLTIADRFRGKVRQAFLDAVQKLRDSADLSQLRAALEAGDVNAAMAALGLGDNAAAEALSAELTKPLEDAFIAAGRATPIKGGELSMRFDLTNPYAVQFVRSYDFGLIRQVSDETRAGVQRVVQAAISGLAERGNPRDQATEIREFIGLTDRQTQAVLNYKSSLEEEERPAEQVARMTERYRQRMLRLRAENIARTETLRAANAGQDAAWKQAADEGLLSASTLRRAWLVTPDDRLCIYCAAIPALNPDGKPLGQPFNTPLGPILYPPAHPQCRCVAVLASL